MPKLPIYPMMRTTMTTIIFLLASTLLGCANMTQPHHALTDAPSQSTPSALDANQTPLPSALLTDEIFFKVITAEIAFQRGYFGAAFATMMSVAEKIHDPRLPKRALEMALIAKQAKEAFIASRLWYQYAPHSQEAIQYYLGFMALKQDWPAFKTIGLNLLEQSVEKDRKRLFFKLQQLLLASPNKQAALDVMIDLAQPYPNYFEAHLAVAQAAYAANDNVRALVEANHALRLAPQSSLAALTLAQVSPTPEAALKVLADFLIKNPQAYDARRAYAGMFVEQKQYLQARRQYELLIRDDPNDITHFYALGILMFELGDKTAAQKNLIHFIEQHDDAHDLRDPTLAYLYLSQIADDEHDGEKALAWLADIPATYQKSSVFFSAQLRRAALLFKYHSPEAAFSLLATLTPTGEEETVKRAQLEAGMLEKNKQPQQAIHLIESSLHTFPDNTGLLYTYAMLLEKQGDYATMEATLRKIMRLTPQDAQAYNALGYALVVRETRLLEAKALLEKALSLSPQDPTIMDSMGWLLFKEARYNEALSWLERAYETLPDAEIATHIAEVLIALKKNAAAETILKKALEKHPDHPSLIEMRQKLNTLQ